MIWKQQEIIPRGETMHMPFQLNDITGKQNWIIKDAQKQRKCNKKTVLVI